MSGGGGGGDQTVMVRRIYFFQDGDPEGTQISYQEVTVSGPDAFDEFTQGNWALTGIGPYYVNPTGGQISPGANLLLGPIGGIGQGVPWWWLLGQTPAAPLPSTPAITTPTSGAGKPFYY